MAMGRLTRAATGSSTDEITDAERGTADSSSAPRFRSRVRRVPDRRPCPMMAFGSRPSAAASPAATRRRGRPAPARRRGPHHRAHSGRGCWPRRPPPERRSLQPSHRFQCAARGHGLGLHRHRDRRQKRAPDTRAAGVTLPRSQPAISAHSGISVIARVRPAIAPPGHRRRTPRKFRGCRPDPLILGSNTDAIQRSGTWPLR